VLFPKNFIKILYSDTSADFKNDFFQTLFRFIFFIKKIIIEDIENS